MTTIAGFPESEYRRRLDAVRGAMAKDDLDMVLVSTPENIFYLTGLDHWGYFAPHMLVVPIEGEMVLITRSMERVTVANQVRNAAFHGHDDHQTPADVAVALIRDPRHGRARATAAADAFADVVERQAHGPSRIGIEMWSSGLSHGLAQELRARLPEDTEWIDVSSLVDRFRVIKSPLEQSFMREAARISDAAMLAALDAIADGVPERDVAAACSAEMIRAGGTFPGFGPFIRSTARIDEEHTSWGDGICRDGDAVFLELSGCFRRYHAPLGRLAFIGEAPPGTDAIADICNDAFAAAVEALKPGARAREVYEAWQGVVDAAGLADYRRHHCGYLVGIGFPPTWTGGNRVSGLRHDSDMEVRTGMTFHMLSWLIGTGRGDFFVSNTVLLGPDGPEILTKVPTGIIKR